MIVKFLRSCRHAARGLLLAARQPNFRWQLLLLAIAFGLAWRLKFDYLRWLFIVLAAALVLMVEMINTGLERLLDVLEPRFHLEARTIKDLAAGASLVAALAALVVGLALFLPILVR